MDRDFKNRRRPRRTRCPDPFCRSRNSLQ
jgi:hypothetical protein